MTTRRDWLGWGTAALALTAIEPATRSALAQPPPQPAIGARVQWPVVHLLDGRQLEPPAPGQAASIIVFFSTGCPFCGRHNAHVQKLLERTRHLPLRVLGVAQDRVEAHVRTYLQRQALAFDVSMDHAPMRAALTRMNGIPLTCAVDRQQHLREVIRGEMFEDDVLALAKWARA